MLVTAIRLYRLAMREARKRGVRALEPRIALNLSRLLSTRGESKAGLRLLEKFGPEFDQFVDARLYFQALADLYEKCGRSGDATVAWSAAKSRAKMIGDVEGESYLASREARSLKQTQNGKLSEAALRHAINTERDPESGESEPSDPETTDNKVGECGAEIV